MLGVGGRGVACGSFGGREAANDCQASLDKRCSLEECKVANALVMDVHMHNKWVMVIESINEEDAAMDNTVSFDSHSELNSTLLKYVLALKTQTIQ